VGICSTTYGDLVCRGCKRFAHEIVQWNGYDETQQQRIWSRLNQLRDEVVAQQVKIIDQPRFRALVEQAGLQNASSEEQIYEMLRRLVAESKPLSKAGLVGVGSEQLSIVALRAIDAEIFTRSQAHYERNFKVLA